MAVEKTVVETTQNVETDEERAAVAAATAAEAAAAATALAASNAAAAELDAAERLRRFEEGSTAWRTGTDTKLAALETTLAETRTILSSVAERLSSTPTKSEVVEVVETKVNPPDNEEKSEPMPDKNEAPAKPRRRLI